MPAEIVLKGLDKSFQPPADVGLHPKKNMAQDYVYVGDHFETVRFY